MRKVQKTHKNTVFFFCFCFVLGNFILQHPRTSGRNYGRKIKRCKFESKLVSCPPFGIGHVPGQEGKRGKEGEKKGKKFYSTKRRSIDEKIKLLFCYSSSFVPE